MPNRPIALENALGEMSGISGAIEPLTYVEDLGDRFRVTMDLPLVEKKDIVVNVSGQHLEISARMCRKIAYRGFGMSQESYHSASFYNSVILPPGVDPEGAKAAFEKGILVIELPKIVRKKRIVVK
jgi:HSP20 family protein